MGRFFGTDGVRGVANRDLTPELVFQLGRAAAHVLLKGNGRCWWGRDTRLPGRCWRPPWWPGLPRPALMWSSGGNPNSGRGLPDRQGEKTAGAMISASP